MCWTSEGGVKMPNIINYGAVTDGNHWFYMEKYSDYKYFFNCIIKTLIKLDFDRNSPEVTYLQRMSSKNKH